MGSFIGHLVPGTFFFLFSLWWAWCIFHRYFICQRELSDGSKSGNANFMKTRRSVKYKSSPAFPSNCCSKNVPLEGILKVVAVIIGMTGEFLTAFDEGKFALGNGQHMTMFFFFGLNGVMDILSHFRVPLPPDIEYSSGILALCMEALLFYYHLHGRTQLDVLVHMLLLYVIVSTAIATAFEMKYQFNVLPALCRVYLTMLQGSWFYHIGLILYPPNGNMWDAHDHEQMMIVTLMFTWHNAAIFVFLLLLGVFIFFRVKTLDRTIIHQSMLHPGMNCNNDRQLILEEELTKSFLLESDEDEV